MWSFWDRAANRPRCVAAVCAGLVLCLFLPFIDKALHIDDWVWLEGGKYFGWNPLNGFPVDGVYQGQILRDIWPYESPHPLLIPYLLKVLQGIFGESPMVLRLIFWCFPLLALWGLSRVYAACSPRGGNLLLLVLFCSLPAFVVNAQNLMTDVPTLAFLLVGAGLSLEGLASGRSSRCWWGGIALTGAVFSSYQALAFIPLLLGYAWLRGRGAAGLRLGMALPLLVPVLVMAFWLGLVYLLYGMLPGLKDSGIIEGEIAYGLRFWSLLGKGVFLLSMVGGSLLFVLPLKMFSVTRWQWFGVAALFGLMVFVFCFAGADLFTEVPAPVFLAFLCTLGIAGLALAAGELARWWGEAALRPLAFLCGSWLAVTLGYNLLLMPFGSARYLLPLFPVLFIVLLRDVDLSLARLRRVAAGCAVLSVLWGGANAWADHAYADVYRVMAAEIAEFRKTLKSGEQVWYIGEWGMRHYFDRAGARYLLADSVEPRSGDFVIIPEMPRFWVPSPRLQPRLDFYASREFRSELPLRLFNRRAGAGFYSHHWGLLPFALSTEPEEVFVLLKVR